MGRDDIDGSCPEDEFPPRKVRIDKPFWIGKYEVTYAQYDYYVWQQQQQQQQQQREEDHEAIAYPGSHAKGRGDHPVVDVNWRQATRYAKWLGERKGMTCRLPTEAEWEYAARAGSETKYPWGNEIDQNRANCIGCGRQWGRIGPAPVGQFAANVFGLHDIVGSVSEWTCSIGRDPFDGSEQRCSNDTEPRVLRGGSWYDSPDFLRVSGRFDDHPDSRDRGIGFRVLCLSPSIDD